MMRRRNRRRTGRPARKWPAIPWRPVGMLGGLLALVAATYAGGAWLLNRPIDTIQLRAPFQRVSAVQLEALMEPHARAGFVDIDLDAARRDLMALPWVESARLRRRFPGTLEVEVREQQPIARWGERGLLNAAGRVFLPEEMHALPELPRLVGPPGTEAEVARRYFAVQEQLQHRGLSVGEVLLDERGAWSFRTSKGLEVRLGTREVDARIARFFEALDRALAYISGEVEYVDMRYPNGFAIGWREAGDTRVAAAGEARPHG